MSKSNYSIERAKTPESVGVNSNQILYFMDDMRRADLEVHSLMVIRGGKVACEVYRSPMTAETPHAMYSVSKSWIATAVGIAIDEGYFSLETRLVDIFPEYAPLETDFYLEKLKVKHLVSMSAGKNPSLLSDKTKVNWLQYYFKCPWSFEPGTSYLYVNENMYVLARIIRKTTGMSVTEFLTPRLYDPLGIDVPFWETDGLGVEAGGWGLYVKTEDLAKLLLCYQNNGKLNGKQIIPEWWVKEAVKAQCDNSANLETDDQGGYGYSIWRNVTVKNSYRVNGMFSQLGIVFEDYDAIVIMTSAIPVIQTGMNLIWRHFPKAFIEQDSKDTAVDFKKKLNSYPLDVPKSSFHSTREKSLIGKTILVNKNQMLNAIGFPPSIMPLAVTYMTTDKAGNFSKIQMAFRENYMKFRWTEGGEVNTIYCGTDGKLRYGDMRLGQIKYRVCSSAYWESDDVLIVEIRPLTTISKRILRFEFHGENRVTIVPTSTPTVHNIGKFLGVIAHDLIKEEKILKAVPTFLSFVESSVEPKMYGRIVSCEK